MSATITEKLTAEERTTRMQDLVSFLTSGRTLNSFLEEIETDLNLEKLQSNKKSADTNIDLDDPGTRLEANYAGALLRDVKYASAGRNFMLKQGYHNAFRELYEGGKIFIDNEVEWSDE